MRKHSKLLYIIPAVLLIALSLTGCWNRKELNTLSIVAGAAIDKAQEPDTIQLTVQIIKPGQIRGGAGGGAAAPGEAFLNLKETGTSIFYVIRNLNKEASRKPYWPHSQILIFSKEAAKEGIRKHLDFFLRDHEPRPLTNILVSEGPAGEILEQKTEQEKIPAFNIDHIVKNVGAVSMAPQITVLQFAERLLSKTTAPIAPLIELVGEGKDKKARITGTAVFKGDRFVGELNGIESRGLLWVLGEVKSGIIKVDCPDSKEKVELEIVRASSEIIPEIQDGRIRIFVKIKEEGNFGDQLCPEDFIKEPAWKKLEKKQRIDIHNEVTAALRKAREYNTDVFGFGSAINRKFPEVWKDLEKNWDKIFPDLEVIVIVDAKLYRFGSIIRTLQPE